MRKLIALLVVAVSLSTSAKIGETMNGCEKRYGKHVKQETKGGILKRGYKSNYFYITACFNQVSERQIVQAISYRALSYDGTSFQRIANEEIAKVDADFYLAENKGSSQWVKIEPNIWKLRDGSRVAIIDNGRLVIISTSDLSFYKKVIDII